ncbi:hypothetical protein H1D32_20765 [Anaerobacillus sp. CMMVII]|uniref:hypothetical protein n=1 Tax=Anaerobacillus sp. CMMVII TaxID=2755588 RepID=UPI0021B732B9|nr:hypothetical protein [Anaerobacillus sp. CMMVII]MCT8139917.1 hypothetical protein [Anaerobacillus sp. CMMVII]
MLGELDGVQLGPIFLSFSLLSLGLSILLAYWTVGYLVKKNYPDLSPKLLNTLQTSGLLFLITFKILPFIFHPAYIFTPSKLLIYSGGPYAVQISTFVSLSYFSYSFYKEKWPIRFLDYLAISAYIYLIVNSLLLKNYGVATPYNFGFTIDGTLYHPVNLYYLLFYSLLLQTMITLFQKQRAGVLAIMLLLAYFFIQVMISPFL